MSVEEAARALVAKLDACVPEINNILTLAHIHGSTYDGPTFGMELEALRAALEHKED